MAVCGGCGSEKVVTVWPIGEDLGRRSPLASKRVGKAQIVVSEDAPTDVLMDELRSELSNRKDERTAVQVGKARQDETRQDETTQGKARRDKTRRDKARQDETRQGEARRDKTRRDKARQDETRQGRTRQDKAR